jgi:hypothetical protein
MTDLEGFLQSWPQGLHLRVLSAMEAYVPFELAVRDAELLRIDRYGTFVTPATSVAGVLEAVIKGRVRKQCFTGHPSGFEWVGPALCRKKKLQLRDLINAAQSRSFASRVKVEEYKHTNYFSSMVFTVIARWPEGDVEGCGGLLPDSWPTVALDMAKFFDFQRFGSH